MLLRAYRLTDRLGLVLIKSSALLGAILLSGGAGLRAVIVRLLSLLFATVVSIVSFIVLVLGTVTRFLLGSGRAVMRLLGVGGYRAGRAVLRRSSSMARRATHDEVDVVIAEDPLRVENRRLSYLVAVLGVIVVGAVIWATDPARSTAVTASASSGNTSTSLLLADATNPPPTEAALISAQGIATPIPTATQIPDALRVSGTVIYSVREMGQSDLWAVDVLSRNAVRITNDLADERDPEWNADGTRLAYASRQDGNWELYVYDLATQASSRVTFDLSFQGNPSWSPDGLFLAYESYQAQTPTDPPNLEIFALPIDGSSAPINITDHPSADFAPTWAPDGRKVAFVSWRENNQDIYVFDLDALTTTNLTNTPLRNEDHPSWSPDGRFIAYSAAEQGGERVFVKSANDPSAQADVVGLGRTPGWSPDGASVIYAIDAIDDSETYLQAVPYARSGGAPLDVGAVLFSAESPAWSERALPPSLLGSGGLPQAVVEPLFIEQTAEQSQPPIYRLNSLADVQTEQPFLSDAVNDSFDALRTRLVEVGGVDFLGQLDDAFWLLERPPEPGEERRNWHMTGRAFSILRNSFRGLPPPIEIIREDDGIDTYWRIMVRVDEDQQSGQLGEPLRTRPWDFASIESGDVEAYNQGGRLKAQIPAGYYVDFTQLAMTYGWERQAAGDNWRANSRSRNYWLFVKDEDLDWYSAMLQIHTEGELVNFAPSQ